MKVFFCMLILHFLVVFIAQGQSPDAETDTVYSVVDTCARPSNQAYIAWQFALLRKADMGGSQYADDFTRCWRLITFIVEKNGALTFVDAPRCTNDGIRANIKQILEAEAHFIPAQHGGKAVRQRMAINFSCIKLE